MKFLYAVAAGIVVVALILSVQILNSSSEDFSTYNTQWNGGSRVKELSSSSQERPVFSAFSLNDLREKNRGVLVMLNPSNGVNITQSDIENIQAFVQNGGSLFLSADFGNANALLDGLGLGDMVRFNQLLLVDEVSNGGAAPLPQISVLSSSNVTAGVHEIYFNYGTTLDVSRTSYPPNTQVLITSGPSSYLTGTLEQSASANTGERPVLMSFDYGKGTVMLLSDPSTFINAMLDKGDNTKLFANIIADLTNGDATAPIIFDESHMAHQPALGPVSSALTSSDAAKYAFVLGAAGFFVLGMIASKRLQKTRPQRPVPSEVPLDEATVMRLIAQRHPRWRQPLLKELLSNLRLHQRRRP